MNNPANNVNFRQHVIARLGFDPAPVVAAELALGHITITVPQFKTDPKKRQTAIAKRLANVAAGLRADGLVRRRKSVINQTLHTKHIGSDTTLGT